MSEEQTSFSKVDRKKTIILAISAAISLVLFTLGIILLKKPAQPSPLPPPPQQLPSSRANPITVEPSVDQPPLTNQDSSIMYYVKSASTVVRNNLAVSMFAILIAVLAVAIVLVLYTEIGLSDDPNDLATKNNLFPFDVDGTTVGIGVAGIAAAIFLFGMYKWFTSKSNPIQTVAADSQAFCDKTTPKESANFVIGTINASIVPAKATAAVATQEARDRFIGAMVGLALSDAYGSAYEFMSPAEVANLAPGDDHKHDGHFSHRLGAWTDDTCMALCLLASAVEQNKFDVDDVLKKYKAWYNSGYMNFDPYAVDFGNTTKIALGSDHVDVIQPSWGNGVIMRLAPVVMQYLFTDDRVALRVAAASGAMTAGDKGALDFTATLAFIMRGFIKGTLTKAEVCQKNFVADKLGWYFAEFPHGLHFSKVLVDWPNPIIPSCSGEEFSSQVVFSRALWSFCSKDSYIDGLKQVVSYGQDADTAAAVYGQIYGSYAGMKNVAGLKRKNGFSLVDGVEDSKLFNSTQRSDAIALLSELLWAKLTSQGTREGELSDILLSDRKVRDLNPKYHFPKVINDVYNGPTNLSTVASQ